MMNDFCTISRATIEQALEAMQQPLGFTGSNEIDRQLRKAITSLRAALEQPQSEMISVQEAWEAAGGNPGIKATKEELLSALRQLDQICDEKDVEAQPQSEPVAELEVTGPSHWAFRSKHIFDCGGWGKRIDLPNGKYSLFTTPPDAAARIAELERELEFAKLILAERGLLGLLTP